MTTTQLDSPVRVSLASHPAASPLVLYHLRASLETESAMVLQAMAQALAVEAASMEDSTEDSAEESAEESAEDLAEDSAALD